MQASPSTQNNAHKPNDQIRIAITGVELRNSEVKTEKRTSIDKRLKQELKTYRSDQYQITHEQKPTIKHGLEKYKSKKLYAMKAGDVYAARNTETNKIDFYLNCVEDKEKYNRRWHCKSNDQSIFPGIGYRYYYNLKHLKNAHDIHEKISKLIEVHQSE